MTLAVLARQLNSRHPKGAGLPALLMLTDRARLPDPLGAARRLPPGSAIILRHYDAPDRPALADALRRLAHRRRLRLLVAGDGRLAAAIGADGLHLPERQALEAGRWRRAHPGWLITVAAHNRAAIRRAASGGADAVLLSPLFATASHPGARPLGMCRFAALARTSSLPVYALGGITGANAGRLRGSGAVGLAAIGALAALTATTGAER